MDIKLISDPSGSTIHLDDTYGDGTALMPGDAYIRCGEEKEGASGDGCGAVVPLADYMANHLICPHCGKQHVLDAAGWVNALADQGSFHELFRNITVADVLPEEDIHAYYREFLDKQKGRTNFTESLVTAHARIYGYPAVLAISEFNFAGGSMGVVFGEKFRMAVEYATRKRWPLVSVCCSGGARLYEGIVALMQMTKTVAAVDTPETGGHTLYLHPGRPQFGRGHCLLRRFGRCVHCRAQRPGDLHRPQGDEGPRVCRAGRIGALGFPFAGLGRGPGTAGVLRQYSGNPGSGAQGPDAPGRCQIFAALREIPGRREAQKGIETLSADAGPPGQNGAR